MILIKPGFEIITYTPSPEKLLEQAGRVCYKSEAKITACSYEEFLKKRIVGGHESILEHASMTVKFICDRGVTHELVRHRLCAFSQESTRYCDYSGGVTFIIPPWVNLEPGEYNLPGDYGNFHKADEYWYLAMLEAERAYKTLLTHEWNPQMARSVLPNSTKTEIVMSCNVRQWRHIFKLRTSMAAHPQMREIMIALLGVCKEIWPVLYGDLK